MKHKKQYSLCPLNELCPNCHIGFAIPLNYTDKDGKTYLFHTIKEQIALLSPCDDFFEDPFEE